MGAQPEQIRRSVAPPGYTQIPNVLLDEVLPVAGAAEWKVTCAIARQTFGWGLETRLLSNADICKLTGLARQSVIRGLRAAEERGYIGKRDVGKNKFAYGIRVTKSDSPETQGHPTSGTGGGTKIRPRSIQEKESPTGSKEKKGRSAELFVKDPDSPIDQVIEDCFEAWRIGVGKNGTSQLTVRRAGQIKARLKEAARGAPDGASSEEALAFARSEVLEAAKGMATSVWHRAEGHTDFDQLFRERGRIEFFVGRLAQTAREAPDAAERFSAYDQAVENR